jgi:SEC-C motif-containing protein
VLNCDAVTSDKQMCPCGSGSALDSCCQPIIDGGAAPTPEALMRSRYTAYVTGAIDHVVSTHHPDSRDEVDAEAASSWSSEAEWVGLEVVDTADGDGPDQGIVEFIARYRLNDGEHAHHERSSFRRIDGAWFYEDGDMVKAQPIVRETPKVGRNEPCPCGSNKKYKKCCGKN